jgi:hypothetical protein
MIPVLNTFQNRLPLTLGKLLYGIYKGNQRGCIMLSIEFFLLLAAS